MWFRLGCDALAEAIATGKAPVNGCPVGGAKAAAAIGEIMGVKADTSAKKTAFVNVMVLVTRLRTSLNTMVHLTVYTKMVLTVVQRLVLMAVLATVTVLRLVTSMHFML